MDLTVDVGQLNTVGSNLINKAGDFNTQVTKLYAAIGALDAAWQGTDQSAYVNKINEQKPIMEQLKAAIDECGNYCKEAARILQETQEKIRQAAQG